MASDFDPNPELRAELTLAAHTLEPKLKGLDELLKFLSPGPLRDLILEKFQALEHRFNLISTVLSRLDRVIDARSALSTTGYPEIFTLALPPDLYAELQGDLEALRIAGEIFTQQERAASITAVLTSIPKT